MEIYWRVKDIPELRHLDAGTRKEIWDKSRRDSFRELPSVLASIFCGVMGAVGGEIGSRVLDSVVGMGIGAGLGGLVGGLVFGFVLVDRATKHMRRHLAGG